MYLGVDYFPFDATESITLGIDFINDLAGGDTVASATVMCAVTADSQVPDPTPAARITGGPFYPNPTTVTYTFASPIAGCKYLITITIRSNGGETITDFTHLSCEVPF